jgi:hypothetical protein
MRTYVTNRFNCALGVLAAAVGCSDEHGCSLAACGGDRTAISFVNEKGMKVAPRGELQRLDPEPDLWTFDCKEEDPHALHGLGCEEGALSIDELFLPNSKVEVRFQLPDGTLSDWQPVKLKLTKHTIEDFNGPGCPCTYYDGTGTVVMVPEGVE